VKICVLVPHLLHGGAEGMAVDLANGLYSIGADVTLVSVSDAASPRFANRVLTGVRRVSLHAAPYAVTGVIRLVRLYRRQQWDAVIAHLTPTLLHGAALSLLPERPVVIYVEHLGVQPPARRGPRELAMRWLLDRVDAIVCVSTALREGYVRRFFPRAYARSHVIRNGVASAVLSGRDSAGARERVRTEFGLGEDELVVGIVGRLVRQKGHREFIEALGRRRDDFAAARVRVLVVGGGELQAEIEAELVRRELDSLVRVTGPRDDVPNVLAALDVLAMPSRWEGLPIALIEAMLAAVPVVATAVGGIPEAVPAGAGILVPEGDDDAFCEQLLAFVSSGRAALTEAGQRARIHAQAYFAADQMVQQYAALADSLVRVEGPHRPR